MTTAPPRGKSKSPVTTALSLLAAVFALLGLKEALHR